MNKRKKVADAKHRARARKLEEKRKALKASGGAPPARPMTPRPAPRPQAAAPRPAAPPAQPAAPAPRPAPPAAPAPSDAGEGQPG
jgi:hypothetical protein